PSPSSVACRPPGRRPRSRGISSPCRPIARSSPTAPDPTKAPAPVWRNSSDSKGGRPGPSAVGWRRGAPRNIRWSQSTPATLPDRKKSAPTVTKKSGHTSPELLVVQLVDNGDDNGADVGNVVDLHVDRVPGAVADHVVLLVLIDGNAGRLNVGIHDPLTLDGFQQGGHLGVGAVHRVGRRGAPD